MNAYALLITLHGEDTHLDLPTLDKRLADSACDDSDNRRR